MLWPTDALVAGTLSQLDVITTRSGCCDQWMPGSIRAWDPLANVCARRMRCILVRVPMRLHLQYGTRKFGQPLEYGTSTTTTARRRRRITHVVFTHSRHRPSQASANKLPFPNQFATVLPNTGMSFFMPKSSLLKLFFMSRQKSKLPFPHMGPDCRPLYNLHH